MTAPKKTLFSFIRWSGGPSEIVCTLVTDNDHKGLLSAHNGLTAFDGALRIFGTQAERLPSLEQWNRPDTWRSAYRELAKGNLIFFAEDAFGNQFAFDNGGVIYFNAEIGQATPFASSFSEWLSIILDDPADTLQLLLYKSWLRNGASLEPSEHLCPTYPFVVRANPPLHELYPANGIEDMRHKGNFAYQIKDLPDGAQIKIKVKSGWRCSAAAA